MSDIGSDRQWVVDLYKTNEGRLPTTAELNDGVAKLQAGESREQLVKDQDRFGDVEGWVARSYLEATGVKMSASGVANVAASIRSGQYGRTDVKNWMTSLPEAVLHANAPAGPTGPTQGQEDARAYMDGYLHQYGLDGLSDWAWQEIQAGNSTDRVIQDLRNQPAYKARFPAMDTRRAKGLPPISEQQYIDFEGQARSIMRSNGMPPGFWDDPSDYTALIANDISPTELQDRVEKGWAKVTTAPPEVRQKFAEWFGPEGDTALAAYFTDPNKAEALLMKAADEARTGGFATLFGMNVSQSRAEQIFNFGKTSDQAIQAYNQIAQIAPLFQETVTEGQDFTKEQQGLNATLGMDATSANDLERRRRTRVAETSGGGGAAVSQQGVGAGAAQ